jgi:PAS domain S-box-containing protein
MKSRPQNGSPPAASRRRRPAVSRVAPSGARVSARATRVQLRATRVQLRVEISKLREALELEKLALEAERRTLIEAQRELEVSRDRYVDLFDFAPIGFATLDRSGNISNINMTGADLLERERMFLIDKPLLPLVAKADRQKFSNHLSQTRQGNGEVKAELHFSRKNGDDVVLEFTSVGVPPTDDGYVRIRTAFRDVTEQRRAQEALRESEERFGQMADSAPVLIWVADPAKRCTFFNHAWLAFTGRTLAQEIGNGWVESVHPDDLKRCLDAYDSSFEARREFQTEYRLRRRDGQYRWTLNHAVPRFARDQFLGYIGSCVDITERKEAEMVLQRAHEELQAQLASIVESSSDAILSKTLDGIITSWNAAAEQMFGYRAEEVISQSISLLIPAKGPDDLANALERIKCGENVEPLETVRVHKNGRRIPVSLTLSPVKDSQGRVTGASAIMRDISQRKRLEAEILKASEREKRRIAEDLHDGLGQQLVGISCLIDSLEKDLAAHGSPHAPAAGKIFNLLNATVSQARSLARGLHPVAQDPEGLVLALEELASRVTDMFRVSCCLKCSQPVLLRNNVTATHLYRIAQEAVTNAIKHGRAKHIEIELSANSEIILAVRNDGVAFEETAAPPRTGLGLRTMNYRAGMIGAKVSVRKRQRARGTEVICTMPRTSALTPGVDASENPTPVRKARAAKK